MSEQNETLSRIRANITVAIEEIEEGRIEEGLLTLESLVMILPKPTDEYLSFARENIEELKRERGH